MDKVKNKRYQRNVLLKNFRLNGHTLGNQPQTQSLELIWKTSGFKVGKTQATHGSVDRCVWSLSGRHSEKREAVMFYKYIFNPVKGNLYRHAIICVVRLGSRDLAWRSPVRFFMRSRASRASGLQRNNSLCLNKELFTDKNKGISCRIELWDFGTKALVLAFFPRRSEWMELTRSFRQKCRPAGQ